MTSKQLKAMLLIIVLSIIALNTMLFIEQNLSTPAPLNYTNTTLASCPTTTPLKTSTQKIGNCHDMRVADYASINSMNHYFSIGTIAYSLNQLKHFIIIHTIFKPPQKNSLSIH